MGDFVYSKYDEGVNKGKGVHSITFDPDGKNFNTWTTWRMAPKSRPFVASPPIKEEYVDVPGADGSLDYTDALAGKARYGRRTGQWDFIIENDFREWTELYSEIMMQLHGKKFDKIVLEDDPTYFYRGRLSVTGSFGNRDFSGVSIAYNLEPYKWPIDSKGVDNWKFNRLIENGIVILYGRFSVTGNKLHNIYNENATSTVATLECTSSVTYYNLNRFNDNASDPMRGISSATSLMQSGMSPYEARTYVLLNSNFNSSYCTPVYTVIGDNQLTLDPGDNPIFFKGDGVITVSYERGKTL